MSLLYMWETRGTEPTPLPWACVASNWEVSFGHRGLDPHATLWSDMRWGKSRVGSQKGLCRDSLGSFPLLSEERVLCDIQEVPTLSELPFLDPQVPKTIELCLVVLFIWAMYRKCLETGTKGK